MRSFEILLDEPEIVETKPKKFKIALTLLVSLLIAGATTILLVGHFKFDWFKSDEYEIDAKINRSLYQANYFSEVKTLYTKFSFDGGNTEEREYILDNNFVVFLTEKKDNMNTAILILLSSTATAENKIEELPHLNIFDEEKLKELEANPDGSKYPLAVFKFTDEGKIEEIKLPYNMDQYNAESIIEFINKTTPKLLRSKKEDMSKGLEITSKKVNNKRTIVQNEAPKQLEDFKGSRYSRYVKTEIENEQITNVESNDNLHMESKPEPEPEGKTIIFGPKDLSYDIKSIITSNDVKYNEKENVELVQKLAKKFVLIDSEELLQIIAASKKEKKETKEIVEENENKPIRNLFDIKSSVTLELAKFDVLGKEIKLKYEAGISGGKAYNKIVFDTPYGKFQFGNTECSGEIRYTKETPKIQIFLVYLPFPFWFISLGGYVQGSFSIFFGLKAGSGIDAQYWAGLEGGLVFGAEVKAGFDAIASLSAFAEGTIIEAAGKLVLTNNGYHKDSGFRLTIGKLVVGIRGVLFWWIKGTLWQATIFDGWTLK